ncbi:MAG TPA: hypothetical protein VF597_00485 [Candidatus Saccharimonadales bacterium]|jgi:CYTH domain-containing protein
MVQNEIETTYLATALPEGLEQAPSKVIVDTYFPGDSVHAKLRIRQKGETYTLTKKTLVNPDDASTQIEENIELTADEYAALRQGNGKTVAKIRYEMQIGPHTAEVDVFTGDLKGLVLVDFEFETVEARDAFIKPDFCGPDVTQEDFIAGGVLAGKSLSDIEADLARYDYTAL